MLVSEIWRGHLWSALPHWVVRAPDDELITWVGAGTPGTFATSRGIRGREHLSRAERKLAALRSCLYNVVEVPSSVSALNFFVEGSWARTSLGWDAEGTFLGWYVNFELPYCLSSTQPAVPLGTDDSD